MHAWKSTCRIFLSISTASVWWRAKCRGWLRIKKKPSPVHPNLVAPSYTICTLQTIFRNNKGRPRWNPHPALPVAPLGDHDSHVDLIIHLGVLVKQKCIFAWANMPRLYDAQVSVHTHTQTHAHTRADTHTHTLSHSLSLSLCLLIHSSVSLHT